MQRSTATSSVTRRSFIAAAAVTTAAAATLGASDASAAETAQTADKEALFEQAANADAPASTAANSDDDWLGEPPAISDDMVTSELSADVVVVGCGIAGVAAVRSAAEEGATVVAIEKATGPQCRSSQFALIGGKLQERWGRTDVDPDLVIDHEMDEGSYFPKRAIWSKWAREGADVFDWYVEALDGIVIGDTHVDDVPDGATAVLPMYHPQPEGYDWRVEAHPCFPLSAWIIPAQQPVIDANMQKALDTGNVTALWGHFAEKLVMEDGRCTGVYARDAETGGYVKVNAVKGVVLATGDYGSNDAMVAHFCPDVAANGTFCLWPNFDVEGNPTNTGDGLKLGARASALVQQHHAPMIHHMGGGDGVLMGVLGISPYLRLDLNGKRFMNEDCPGQQTENQIEHLKGKKCYMFWDADWAEQIPHFAAQHGGVAYVLDDLPQNNVPDGAVLRSAVDDAVTAGNVMTADSIEALLAQIKDINRTAALASVERYNELARAGYDEDFGKPAGRMFPLQSAPFYCCVMGQASMLACIGGLESDEECHTFDADRNVIDGLYVAGNIQGNRFAVQYPIALKGASHSMALYYGYVAGKNAVAEV